jgi:hypothetical protein
MSASRVQIPIVVQSLVEVETVEKVAVKVVVPVHEAKVEIKRRDGNPIKVYETESGAEISNKLLTDTNGQVKAWVEEGPYLITAEGGEPNIALTNYTFDAITGRGVEHVADEVVALTDLVLAQQSFFVPIGTVLLYGGEAAAPPTGFLTCSGQEVAQATYPVLYGKLKAKYGSASAGNFRLPTGLIENVAKQTFVSIIRHD